jgi:RNA polymerase sigma factor (sigma-70 family)
MTHTLSEVTNELVSRAADGEAGAVEAIVRALEQPVYAVALRMLRDRQDAEDATQEALIRIVTRLAQFRGEARFSTWAWRIAVRRILDFRGRPAAAAAANFTEFAVDLADGLDGNAAERTEEAILHQQLKVICSRAMLQCLDPDHRIAFVLGEILALSSQEAAEILEIEAPAFRKRLSRARAALVEFLNRNCGVFNPSAPCACHRRLGRALELRRIQPSSLEAERGELVRLRAHLSTLSEVERLAEYYRSDLGIRSKRDFIASVRSMLGRLGQPMENA